MEKYFILHGSFASSRSNWFGWLAETLRTKGKDVYAPDMPIGVGFQTYSNWEKVFKAYVGCGLIDDETTIIAHSISPVFVSKFLVQNKIKVNKLIFVCGFNNFFGITSDYDEVNRTMYFDELKHVKNYAQKIVCFYSDNDPYVSFDAEKDFADQVADEQVLMPGAGHINSESGFTEFNEVLKYL